MKNDKLTIIMIISTIVPIIGTLATGIGTLINNESLVWKIIFLCLAFITALAGIISLLISLNNERKIKATLSENKNQVDLYKKDYEDLLIFTMDGKKYLSNEAFISVDKNLNTYFIRVRKKFEIMSTDFDYYMINMFCDKFLGNKELSKQYYREHKLDWDNVNFKANLVIKRKNGSVEQYNNLNIIKIDTFYNYYFAKIEYKKKMKSGQVSIIPFQVGDIFTLEYSFSISPEYWGNYIERAVGFSREKLCVYFDKKMPGLNIENICISLINKQGIISEIEADRYEWSKDESGEYYKLTLPVEQLDINQLKNCSFRVMWDANSIFKRETHNTENAEVLGLGATYKFD